MESDKEENWPFELLELRDKFTSNAKQEIQELKKLHCAELARLKDEHNSVVARIFEQHKKEINILKTNVENVDNKQKTNYVRSSDNSIVVER